MAALLDASTVSVPFESLKRVTRERKYAVEEVEGVLKGVAAAAAATAPAGGSGECGIVSEGGATPAEAAAARLEQYVQQLQGLKRKVGGRGVWN